MKSYNLLQKNVEARRSGAPQHKKYILFYILPQALPEANRDGVLSAHSVTNKVLVL